MQNAGMAALGLDCRYFAFDVHPEALESALEGARQMRFLGLNLTVPHKILAVPLMDELDITARQVGAVNTVRFEGLAEDGSWRPLIEFPEAPPDQVRSCGFNTDADALVRAIHEDLDFHLEDARILLLGVGGAGRVAALKLAEQGAEDLFLVNRTVTKAEEVAEEIKERFPQTHVMVSYPHRPVDLIINATSLGLRANDPLPINLDRFSLTETRAVYDMVYRPAETLLLLHAREAGCRVANGLGMLLHQGARALEIWTGQPAPLDVMREALMAEVYGH